MPRKLPVCYLLTLMVVYVSLQTPDTMVSMSNLDDIPALDMSSLLYKTRRKVP